MVPNFTRATLSRITIRGAFALTFLIWSAISAAEPEVPRTLPPNDSNEPNGLCIADVKRELNDYFRKESHATEFYMSIENLPLAVTSSDNVPRPYYLWVRASTQNAKFYRTGVARVVTRVNSKCDVTGFISKAEILASRKRLETYFPPELIPRILSIADTPQK
jgi:hypothetical protein